MVKQKHNPYKMVQLGWIIHWALTQKPMTDIHKLILKQALIELVGKKHFKSVMRTINLKDETKT